MGTEQLSQAFLNIFMIQSSLDFHRQTLARVLINDVQNSKRSSVLGSFQDKIITPDMIGKLRFETQTGIVIQPQSAPFGLFRGHFQAFLSP